MSKNMTWIVVALGAVLVVIAYLFGKASGGNPQNNTSSLNTQGKNSTSESFLPIPLDHPSVVNTSFYYVLKGIVQTVDSSNIVLVSQGIPLPVFSFTPATKVIQSSVGKSQEAKVQDIKAGNTVFVTVLYDAKKRQVSVSHVTIVQTSQAVSSPAPSLVVSPIPTK